MRAPDQAAIRRIGIVLGVVLTCWFLIAIVATRIPWPATPTPVISVTATTSGGGTPATPLTPTSRP